MKRKTIGHGLMTVICRFELGRRKIECNECNEKEIERRIYNEGLSRI